MPMTIMPTSTTIDPDSDYGRFLADTPQPSRPVSLVRRSSCVSSIQTLDDPCTTESLPQLRRDSDKTDSGAGSGSGESTDSPVKRSTVWRRFKKVFREPRNHDKLDKRLTRSAHSTLDRRHL